MTELFVLFDEAKALKEFGFDESCVGYYIYDVKGELPPEFYYHKIGVDGACQNPLCKNSLHSDESKTNAPKISAPLYAQAFKWFRDNHNMHGCVDLSIISFEDGVNRYQFHVDDIRQNDYIYHSLNDYIYHSSDGNLFSVSYEESELACLKKMIEILSTKQ